jgi:hypothetical protein
MIPTATLALMIKIASAQGHSGTDKGGGRSVMSGRFPFRVVSSIRRK